MFHPIFRGSTWLFDQQAKRDCCVNSDNCIEYEKYRPQSSCTFFRPPFFAWFFGDPHISTLDGLTYTFNGLGEFVMFQSEEAELQARTYRVIDTKTNQPSFATSFSAFVLREIGTITGFQIQLTTDLKGKLFFNNVF